MVTLNKETVRGWGRAAAVDSLVGRPKNLDELKTLLAECVRRDISVTIRAGGNSYGDLITNSEGAILDITALDRIIDVDFDQGVVVAEPGVPLGRIVDECLPRDWNLGVVPGSPFVTVGGAIGNNIHGKNSSVQGNFESCVRSIRVLFADGTVKNVSREENRDIFDAVIGGLGMCGIVVEAVLALERVKSPYLEVELVRFKNAEEMVSLFDSSEKEWDMLVAWMDAFHDRGRGVLEKGRWIEPPEGLGNGKQTAMPGRETGAQAREWIGRLCRPFVGRWPMRLLNAAFYHMMPMLAKKKVRHFAQFNFIVTRYIPEPPSLYPGGMVEVQLLLPAKGAAGSIERVIALGKAYKAESWWCGIKKHRADDFPLSFSGDGYSFSVNLSGRHAKEKGFPDFIDALISLTVELGGRVYLGKDLVLRPEHVPALYPKTEQFLATRRRLDPGGVFQSDLARRLFSG